MDRADNIPAPKPITGNTIRRLRSERHPRFDVLEVTPTGHPHLFRLSVSYKKTSTFEYMVNTMEEVFSKEILDVIKRIEARTERTIDQVLMYHEMRFKCSDVSGSEWRTTCFYDVYSKGEHVDTFCGWTTEHDLSTKLQQQLNQLDPARSDNILVTRCNQCGCGNSATIFYRLNRFPCLEHPWESCACAVDKERIHRAFCDEHGHRGDCNYDDMDDYYTRIDRNGVDCVNPPKAPMPDSSVISVPRKVVLDLSDKDLFK